MAYIDGFHTVVFHCCPNKGQIRAEYLAGINPLEHIGNPVGNPVGHGTTLLVFHFVWAETGLKSIWSESLDIVWIPKYGKSPACSSVGEEC